MKISDNKFVSLTYDLKVGESGEELELMESATTENPLEFIYGTNSMIDAFEKNLYNMEAGESFSFVITPDLAYGDYEDDRVVELPKNIFEVDGKFDDNVIFEGNTIPMMDANGNRLNGSVLEVKDDVIKMDFNHPLAGETLNFAGKIISVREASPEEIAALLAPQEGGCGCGGCDCGDGEEGSCSTDGEGGCGCGCGSC